MLKSAIDALKGNPLVLALLVFNIIILGAIYLGVREGRAQLTQQMTLVLERCLPTQR